MNDNSLLLFVSSYGSADEECIRLYAFDPETGESQYVSGLSGISNPSFLCFGPDGKHLYAVGEDDGETASANTLLFNDNLRTLELISSQPTLGGAPCNICVSPDQREVITSNYVGGSISVFPILDDQSLSECQTIRFEGYGPNAERQEQAHLHAVNFTPDGQYMLANDLGTDRIHLFPITKGESVISQPGKHPRNFTLSPDGCFLLVACRDSHVVQVFSRDADSGLLTDTGHDITQDKPVCVLF